MFYRTRQFEQSSPDSSDSKGSSLGPRTQIRKCLSVKLQQITEIFYLETDVSDKNTENGQVRRRQAENKIETKRKFFGKRTKSLNVNFPAIKDVSIVDRVSRIVFPFTFMIFNLIYWTFYNFF